MLGLLLFVLCAGAADVETSKSHASCPAEKCQNTPCPVNTCQAKDCSKNCQEVCPNPFFEDTRCTPRSNDNQFRFEIRFSNRDGKCTKAVSECSDKSVAKDCPAVKVCPSKEICNDPPQCCKESVQVQTSNCCNDTARGSGETVCPCEKGECAAEKRANVIVAKDCCKGGCSSKRAMAKFTIKQIRGGQPFQVTRVFPPVAIHPHPGFIHPPVPAPPLTSVFPSPIPGPMVHFVTVPHGPISTMSAPCVSAHPVHPNVSPGFEQAIELLEETESKDTYWLTLSMLIESGLDRGRAQLAAVVALRSAERLGISDGAAEYITAGEELSPEVQTLTKALDRLLTKPTQPVSTVVPNCTK